MACRCETDVAATSDQFKEAADALAEHCAKSAVTDLAGFKTSTMAGGGTVESFIAGMFGKIKENMQIRRLARIEGCGACYVHHNGKVGAAIVCDRPPGEAGRQACMHIASTPVILGLAREDVGPEAVAEARESAREQAQGKPEPIIEKIVAGKMDKWFAERVLLEQPFVMDDKQSVGEFAKNNGFHIRAYLKFEVGEKI